MDDTEVKTPSFSTPIEASVKNEETEVKIYSENLSDFSNLGMSGVDPADIQPPKILLMQKSSNVNDFSTRDGKHPAYGQFFNTGTMEIYDDFECYFLIATKGTFFNKEKGEEMPQYLTIGVLSTNPSMESVFGYNFRASASYALSPLFTAARTNRQPMFAIKCKVETKELTNAKGQAWRIPVVRVGEFEKDSKILSVLYALAKGFDIKSDKLVTDLEEDDVPF